MIKIAKGNFHVFTFKDGMLARLAHDLRLSLDRFEVELEGDMVIGRFWPASLKVDGTIRKGELDPGQLSNSDKRKVLENIQREVLFTKTFDQVFFRGSLGEKSQSGSRLSGDLSILGRSKPISMMVREDEGMYIGEIELIPSRWGIKPFKALAGAIKLKDRVQIKFELMS